MKRRVNLVGQSTLTVSLPNKWVKEYNIKKGNELEVDENGGKITISTEKSSQVNSVELDINNLDPMILRYICCLYRKGVDEIKVIFNKPELIESVQKTMGKEAVGYEITEQGKNHCIIKHVSGELEDFEPILRRTFLLLISMAEESLNSIKINQFDNLKNIAFLEEANNRFTTTCRRSLNKKGYKDTRIIGPLYYTIEEMEKIADEYKYLCYYLYNSRNKKIKISEDTLEMYNKTNEMLKQYYELFYKFEKEKLVSIGKQRKVMVDQFIHLFEKNSSNQDKLILHHLFVIMQKIFCLVGAYLVIKV